MPATWHIQHWPRCTHHVLLSHCAENRNELIIPVFEELAQSNVISWLDQHHYPSGRESHEALRESLLKCRHVIYVVTPEMLQQGRGWCALECGYSAVIQRILNDISHVELPLFFVDRTDPALQRSVWSTLVDRGIFIPLKAHKQPVTWAVRKILQFVRREETWASEILERLPCDHQLQSSLANHNLRLRVTACDLPPLEQD